MGKFILLFDLTGSQFILLASGTVLISILLLGLVLYIGYQQFIRPDKNISWSKIASLSSEIKTIVRDATAENAVRQRARRKSKMEMSQALQSVKGLTSTRKEEDEMGNQHPYFEKIKESAEMLDRYFQKYMGNPFAIEDVQLSEFKLFDILNDIIDQSRIKVGSNRVKIYLDVDHDVFIRSDYSRLYSILEDIIRQMLTNYDVQKRASYIKITSRIDSNEVYLTISDNGNGHSAEELPMIFTVYGKSKGYFKNPYMGLFLIKEYIKKLNSCLKVFSEKGEGSMFVFHFDCETKITPFNTSELSLN